jgi:hypothetical protein
MVGKSSKSHGEWDGEKLRLDEGDDWDGEISRWIKDGKDLSLMYEDLRDAVKGVGSKEVGVRVYNHDYEDGKIPMMYLVFDKGVDKSLKGKLEKKLMDKGLIEYDVEIPFEKEDGVRISCFSYRVEDYGVVGNCGVDEG